MIDKIKGNRIAADNNKYLIALWQGLQANLNRPYEITKQMYDNAKNDFKNGTNEFYSDFEIAWIGFMASFNGIFYSGFVGNKHHIRDKHKKTYSSIAIRNITNQFKNLKDVCFVYADYKTLEIPEKSFIYCDIPYFNTSSYTTSNLFNHLEFYTWAELKSKEGNKVFISEYWMPEDRFTKIWQKQVNCNITANKPQTKIESLFIPKNQEVKRQLSFFDCL
jgi:DNA adenine methylase